MSTPLLRLDSLCKYYTGGQSVVMGLNHVSMSFQRGEFVAITGESGSGKSTLAHVIGGILPYESGEMYLNGKPTSHYDSSDWERYRRDNISFISQNYGILPGSTVLGNVICALRLAGMDKKPAGEQAERILRQVDLWEFRSRRAAKLSSGQKQRLSIARALAKPAPILIADEPTGNLDPENSAKVISLLAEAAKERLVLLITHEFEEAAPYATRRITIQDGQIVMDAPLRPANDPAELPAAPRQKKKQPLGTYVAGVQLGGRPVWTSLVLIFFALTAFAVFAFLGTFIIALDDTSTRIYDNSAFRNGDMERIVVTRADGGPMTQEDYEKLVSVKYVESLEPWGYVTDVNYGYRPGVDYQDTYQQVNDGTWDDPNRYTIGSISLTNRSGYLQTIPVMPEGRTFLTAGRLPENINEVVLAGSASRIGETMPVYLYDVKNWSINSLVTFEVTVVGVTDYGSGLYFHSDLGRAFNNATMTRKDGRHYSYFLTPAQDLADNECRMTAYFQDQEQVYHLKANVENAMEMAPRVNNLNVLDYYELLDNVGLVSSTYWSHAEVSQATFGRLTVNKRCDQVSLTIEDYAYTQRVLDSIHGLGYLALSPYQQGSTRQDAELAAERMQTLTICCAALLAVVLLQVIVLRALYNSQIESYNILSNMGLACGTAKASVLWQVLLFTAGGQALGFGGILLCGQLGVERIVHLLRYLPPVYFLLLCGVHLVVSLIAAVWIARAVQKQVYPLAGQEYDLALDTEEVEA